MPHSQTPINGKSIEAQQMMLMAERFSSNEVFGKALTALLGKRRLTKSQLAKELGVTRSHVQHWVAGDYLPRSKTIDALARTLKVSYCTLFTLPRSE